MLQDRCSSGTILILIWLVPVVHAGKVAQLEIIDPFSSTQLFNEPLPPLKDLFNSASHAYKKFMLEFFYTFAPDQEPNEQNLEVLIHDEDLVKKCVFAWEQLFDSTQHEVNPTIEKLKEKANELFLTFSKYTPRIVHYLLVKIYVHKMITYWLEASLRFSIGWVDAEDEHLIRSGQKIADEVLNSPVEFLTFIFDFFVYLRHYHCEGNYLTLKTALLDDDFFKRITVEKSNILATYFDNILQDPEIVFPLSDKGFYFKPVDCKNEEEKRNFVFHALHKVRIPGYPPHILGYCSWPKEYLDAFHRAIIASWGKRNVRSNPGEIVFINDDKIESTLSELRLIAQEEYLGEGVSREKVFKRLVDRYRPFYLFQRFLRISAVNQLFPATRGESETTLVREIFLCHLQNPNKKIREEFRKIVEDDTGINGEEHRRLLLSLDDDLQLKKKKNTLCASFLVGNKNKPSKTLNPLEKAVEQEINDLLLFFKKPDPSSQKPVKKGRAKSSKKPPTAKNTASVATLLPPAQTKSLPSTHAAVQKKTKKKKKRKKVVIVSQSTSLDDQVLFTAQPVNLQTDQEIYEKERALQKISAANAEGAIMVKNKEPGQFKKKNGFVQSIKGFIFDKPQKTWDKIKKNVLRLDPHSPGYHVILERLYVAQRQVERRQSMYHKIVSTQTKMLMDSSAIHIKYQFYLSMFKQAVTCYQTWLNDPSNFDDEKQQALIAAHQRIFSHSVLFLAQQQFADEIALSNERFFSIERMLKDKNGLDPKEVNSVYFAEKDFHQGLGTMAQQEISLYIMDIARRVLELEGQLQNLEKVFADIDSNLKPLVIILKNVKEIESQMTP